MVIQEPPTPANSNRMMMTEKGDDAIMMHEGCYADSPLAKTDLLFEPITDQCAEAVACRSWLLASSGVELATKLEALSSAGIVVYLYDIASM